MAHGGREDRRDADPRVGDVGLAEDLAQEALVDALTQWPNTGVPRNPGAWLTTVAKRKAIDHWRRQDNLTPSTPRWPATWRPSVDERLGSRTASTTTCCG